MLEEIGWKNAKWNGHWNIIEENRENGSSPQIEVGRNNNGVNHSRKISGNNNSVKYATQSNDNNHN